MAESLLKRGDIWYVRLSLPLMSVKNLVDAVELQVSLKTRDKRDANLLKLGYL